MKILAIDDNPVHLKSAEKLLLEHTIMTASTYDEAHFILTNRPEEFEVVLIDLLMPASSHGQTCKKHIGEEMPVGIFLALLAATRGVKFVAVFSDKNHHEHPISACFDDFSKAEAMPTPFFVNHTKMILTNARVWVDHFDPNDPTKKVTNEERLNQGKPSIPTKNWKKVLNYLLKC